MPELPELTQLLTERIALDPDQCERAAHLLTLAEIPAPDKAAFLTALHDKGETVAEVTAFARAFRAMATNPGLEAFAKDAIDIVGTGGTGCKSFNISSVTAISVAAAGCRVLKHGNRAITSQSGSADFLSLLGIQMDADPQRLRRSCEALNFCFFFAPAFHPAFKEIMPVRKLLASQGKRSIFNILGPLINPAQPHFQLLGVFDPQWVQPLAESMAALGLQRGVVVCSEMPDGRKMDEFTTAGRNHLQGFGSLQDWSAQTTAETWGYPIAHVHDLAGGSAEDNFQLLQRLIAGRGPKGLLDTLLLNIAVAFHILQRVENLSEGHAVAMEVFLGGRLTQWIDDARDFYHSKSLL